MTVFEHLSQHMPLHMQRIAELTDSRIHRQSSGNRWMDLAGLFLFAKTEEGFDYWNALGAGNGLP